MKRPVTPKEYWPYIADALTAIAGRAGAAEICKCYVICMIVIGVMSASARTIVVPTQPVSLCDDSAVQSVGEAE